MPRGEIKRQTILWMLGSKGEPLPCVHASKGQSVVMEVHENQRVTILRTADECSPLSETCACVHVHAKNDQVS